MKNVKKSITNFDKKLDKKQLSKIVGGDAMNKGTVKFYKGPQ